MKVAWIMGSISDMDVIKPGLQLLKEFGVEVEARVLSAHRTTEEALDFVKGAEAAGHRVIIAAAGKAAHLPGVLASVTALPVIGLPIKSSMMDGLDSLLSIVMMPKGVPVMTVGVNAAENAALSACRILGGQDDEILKKYKDYVEQMRQDVLAMDATVVAMQGEE